MESCGELATVGRDVAWHPQDDTAAKYLAAGDPVISVDTKKKENIGNFINKGAEYRTKKDPRKVLDHDFPIEELGKISPYGGYKAQSSSAWQTRPNYRCRQLLRCSSR
jgi:hypothetical protein